jgi:type VI secretion system protein ImpA
MIEECWDRLNPPIEEDGDLERRAAPFFWLDDPDRGARLPTALRMVPMLRHEGNTWGVLAIRGMPPQFEPISSEEFEKVLLATPAEQCIKMADAIEKAREELTQLGIRLRERLEPQIEAPGLTSLQRALEECHIVAQEIRSKKSPVSEAEPDKPTGDSAETGAGSRAPSSRAEAYQQLSHAAAVLRELEPHSPIPYLVQRAVELGTLPFPLLIKALIRDANVINELNRELGIKEPPPE